MNINTKSIVAILTASLGLLVNPSLRGADNAALMEPVKSVYDHYLKVQTALASDSLKGVDGHANAIAKAVRSDDTKMLPSDIAKEADNLARAKDLKSAREALKPLSNSLIKYLAENKVPKGTYHQLYCPMAKASWLQAEKTIQNPYMGKAMLTCGEFKD